MEDGTIDLPGVVINTYFIEFLNAAGYNATAILRRMKLKNWVNITGTNTGFIRNNINTNGSYTATVTLDTCLLKNFGNLLYGSTSKVPIRLNLINSTVVPGPSQLLYNDSVVDARTIAQITGNIFVADNTFLYPLYLGNLVPDCSSGRCGPPAGWTVKGNIVYKAGEYPAINLDRLADNSSQAALVDETNHFINPDFADPDNDDYTPRNGRLTGKGYAANLPATDINGNAWRGSADVGAFRNPVAATPTLLGPNTLIVVGDSIAAGMVYRLAQDLWLSGWTVYGAGSDCNATAGANCAAWGGSLGSTASWLIDRAVDYWGVPGYFVILTYGNSLSPRGNNPINLTTTQAADDVLTMASKARAYGSTPILLGMMPSWHATQAGQLTIPMDFNSKVATMAASNGYAAAFPLNHFVFSLYYANVRGAANPGYYTDPNGLLDNVHPSDPEGRRALASVLEDILLGRYGYYVTQSGATPLTSGVGLGTCRYPLSIAGFNAQTGLGGYQALPIGTSGMKVSILDTVSTQFVAPVDGANGKPMRLKGYGLLSGGWDFTGKSHWLLAPGAGSLNGFTYMGQ
jgi:hypothetical protein